MNDLTPEHIEKVMIFDAVWQDVFVPRHLCWSEITIDPGIDDAHWARYRPIERANLAWQALRELAFRDPDPARRAEVEAFVARHRITLAGIASLAADGEGAP